MTRPTGITNRGPYTHEAYVPAGPFIAWLEEKRRIIEAEQGLFSQDTGRTALAERLGVSDRLLRRYVKSLDGMCRPTDEFVRSRVQDMIETFGARFEEVYPDHVPDVDLEPDAYCPTCEDQVTPINGACPWCGTGTRDQEPRPVREFRISVHQLRLMYLLHTQGGMAVQEIARQTYRQFGYGHARTCAAAIRQGWERIHMDAPMDPKRRAA